MEYFKKAELAYTHSKTEVFVNRITALQLVPGEGATVGNALTSDPRIAGVVFTGSTQTAKIIRATCFCDQHRGWVQVFRHFGAGLISLFGLFTD